MGKARRKQTAARQPAKRPNRAPSTAGQPPTARLLPLLKLTERQLRLHGPDAWANAVEWSGVGYSPTAAGASAVVSGGGVSDPTANPPRSRVPSDDASELAETLRLTESIDAQVAKVAAELSGLLSLVWRTAKITGAHCVTLPCSTAGCAEPVICSEAQLATAPELCDLCGAWSRRHGGRPVPRSVIDDRYRKRAQRSENPVTRL